MENEHNYKVSNAGHQYNESIQVVNRAGILLRSTLTGTDFGILVKTSGDRFNVMIIRAGIDLYEPFDMVFTKPVALWKVFEIFEKVSDTYSMEVSPWYSRKEEA